MITLAKRFFNDRAAVIDSISAKNDYLIIRHKLFLKLLDLITVLLILDSYLYLFFDVSSALQLNAVIPPVLLILVITVNFFYLKTKSLKITGIMVSLLLYVSFALPAFSYVVTINYPTYYILLLPILSLLVLGRSALIINGLIGILTVAVLLYLHDLDSYSIEAIAADERAIIIISSFYISSYLLIIFACSNYEKLITVKKTDILTTRKILAELSNLDPLLKIYSRKALISRFNKLQAQSSPLAQKVSIIALNINGLREFNYEYGQNFTNDILLTITARMNFLLGEKDIIGRVSSTKFVIIIMTNDKRKITMFFEKLLDDVCETVAYNGYTAEIDVDAGYIFYTKRDGDLLEQLSAITMKNYTKKTIKTEYF
ncbi:MAG: diguanylate cyclase (GGDEF)-like protein [Porticoccus sp.]|jgi:diguanylate cyclase (GGDEF)-like protein